MRISYLLLTASVLTGSWTAASAESESGKISVRGHAEKIVAPDYVRISGSFLEREAIRAEALEAIAGRNSVFTETLPEFEGVEAIKIETEDLTINAVRPRDCLSERPSSQLRRHARRQGADPNAEVPPRACDPTAFLARLEFKLQVEPASLAGNVVSYLTEIGTENVNIDNYDVRNRFALQSEVDKAATVDALAKATVLAEAAGVRLGKIASVNQSSPPQRFDRRFSLDTVTVTASKATRPSVPIELEDSMILFTSDIHVTVDLVQDRE